MRGHLIETEVQDKSGRVRKKILVGRKGKWIARGRYIYGLSHDLDRSQRVFHIDGDRTNDEPDNLVAIAFGVHSYKLSQSRVVFTPRPISGKVRINMGRGRHAVAA